MKSSFCIALLLAAAFQCAVLQSECPNPLPAECAGVSVCNDNSCPRYTNVRCCVESIDGECVAQFYQLPKMRRVTEKCFQGIDSCSTKECPERRTCVEEVLDCPESKPDCGIRRVRASCILMEISHFPTNCDEVACGSGTSCVVTETRRGTEALCEEVVPTSCEEVQCDDGMYCVERNKPRCVPTRPSERPTDCSQLECHEDLVCMLLDDDRGAKCVKPPPPTSCLELTCAPGLVCETAGLNGRVKCVVREPEQSPTIPPIPPTDPNFTGEVVTRPPPPPPVSIARQCNEIECEDGYECKLVIDSESHGSRRPVAACVPAECPLRRTARPPSHCGEISCGRDEFCVLCGEFPNTRARCMQRGKSRATLNL